MDLSYQDPFHLASVASTAFSASVVRTYALFSVDTSVLESPEYDPDWRSDNTFHRYGGVGYWFTGRFFNSENSFPKGHPPQEPSVKKDNVISHAYTMKGVVTGLATTFAIKYSNLVSRISTVARHCPDLLYTQSEVISHPLPQSHLFRYSTDYDKARIKTLYIELFLSNKFLDINGIWTAAFIPFRLESDAYYYHLRLDSKLLPSTLSDVSSLPGAQVGDCHDKLIFNLTPKPEDGLFYQPRSFDSLIGSFFICYRSTELGRTPQSSDFAPMCIIKSEIELVGRARTPTRFEDLGLSYITGYHVVPDIHDNAYPFKLYKTGAPSIVATLETDILTDDKDSGFKEGLYVHKFLGLIKTYRPDDLNKYHTIIKATRWYSSPPQWSPKSG